MCSRIDQNGKVINFLPKFSKKPSLAKPRYNIGIGQKAQFIVQEQNNYDVVEGIFGYVPAWAKEVKQLYYNARSEGKYNDSNDRNFNGTMGIFEMPSFRDAIKKSRCVIPVSASYEGPEDLGLDKPFQILSKQEPVLFLAGLWGTHHDPKKNETFSRFSIITTPGIDVTASIGHHRCPLMLNEEFIETWLDPETSQEDLEAIMQAHWQPEQMEAIAIDTLAIKKRESDSPLAVAASTLFN